MAKMIVYGEEARKALCAHGYALGIRQNRIALVIFDALIQNQTNVSALGRRKARALRRMEKRFQSKFRIRRGARAHKAHRATENRSLHRRWENAITNIHR